MYQLVLLFLVGISIVAKADSKGEEIAKKYFDLKTPKTISSVAAMVIIDDDGNKRNRTLKMVSKDDEQGTWSYIEFLEPADIKGTKFLTIPHKDGEDEQRLYLPALKKVRRISSSGKSGKFVGSDFFYYDMENREYDEYTYTYIKEVTKDDEPYWIVEMKPKDAKSPYDHSNAWINKNDNFVYRLEMFDSKRKQHTKTMAIVETKTIDGCIIPTKIVMDNHRDNSKTLLLVSNIELDKEVDSGVFTIQNLEKK